MRRPPLAVASHLGMALVTACQALPGKAGVLLGGLAVDLRSRPRARRARARSHITADAAARAAGIIARVLVARRTAASGGRERHCEHADEGVAVLHGANVHPRPETRPRAVRRCNGRPARSRPPPSRRGRGRPGGHRRQGDDRARVDAREDGAQRARQGFVDARRDPVRAAGEEQRIGPPQIDGIELDERALAHERRRGEARRGPYTR